MSQDADRAWQSIVARMPPIPPTGLNRGDTLQALASAFHIGYVTGRNAERLGLREAEEELRQSMRAATDVITGGGGGIS